MEKKYICTTVPEGIPIHLVEFVCSNGIKGSFCIGYDGRSNGNGVAAVDTKFKKTISSWIYYLVR